jgi:hypothetical protein
MKQGTKEWLLHWNGLLKEKSGIGNMLPNKRQLPLKARHHKIKNAPPVVFQLHV